jgi:hypothetical protein
MEHLVKVLHGVGILTMGTSAEGEAEYDLSFVKTKGAEIQGRGMIAADLSLLRSAANASDLKLRTSEGRIVELAVRYIHADTNSADVEVRGELPDLED